MRSFHFIFILVMFFLLGITHPLSAHDGWYIGASTGLDRVEIDKTFQGSISATDTVITDETQKNDLGILLNTGYRLNDNIAFNLDFTFNEANTKLFYRTNSGDFNASAFTAKTYYLTPSVHLIYPVTPTFDIYTKIGMALVGSTWSNRDKEEDYNATTDSFTVVNTSSKGNDWDVILSLGLGGQWEFLPSWQATIEYLYTKSEFNPEEEENGLDYSSQSLLIGIRYVFE